MFIFHIENSFNEVVIERPNFRNHGVNTAWPEFSKVLRFMFDTCPVGFREDARVPHGLLQSEAE